MMPNLRDYRGSTNSGCWCCWRTPLDLNFSGVWMSLSTVPVTGVSKHSSWWMRCWCHPMQYTQEWLTQFPTKQSYPAVQAAGIVLKLIKAGCGGRHGPFLLHHLAPRKASSTCASCTLGGLSRGDLAAVRSKVLQLGALFTNPVSSAMGGQGVNEPILRLCQPHDYN